MASKILTGLIVIFVSMGLSAQEPRARDIGVPFAGDPGTLNTITDVPGVTVGFETIIKDLPNGKAVRTGVTSEPSGDRGWTGWTASSTRRSVHIALRMMLLRSRPRPRRRQVGRLHFLLFMPWRPTETLSCPGKDYATCTASLRKPNGPREVL